MQGLKELVDIVSRQRISKISSLNDQIGSTKAGKLYDLVLSGEVNSDEEAVAVLYQNGKGSENFQKLKQRLKSKLLNTLFFIDPDQKDLSPIQRAFYTTSRNVLVINILIERGAYGSARKLAEKTLKLAIKYHLSDLALQLCHILRIQYGFYLQDNKKYIYYKRLLDNYSRIQNAEMKVEGYYVELISKQNNSRSSRDPKLISLCNRIVGQLEAENLRVKTFKYNRFKYLIHVLYYELNTDYNGVIRTCNEAITYFKNLNFKLSKTIASFDIRKVVAYFQLRDYENSRFKLAESLKTETEGSYNWYVYSYYLFLVNMHSGEYADARQLLNRVLNSRYFSKVTENLRQNFLIFQAFIHFLERRSYLKVKDRSSSFRVFRFLNDVPIFAKDKRGLNIAILVLHILFLIDMKRYEEIFERMDAIKQYSHRYLRKDETFRSNCFIKMILQVTRADFNRKRTERYAEKYWNNLRKTPINIAEQGIEVEIIPYEDLWPMVLKMLN